MNNSRNTKSLRGKTGKRKRSACRQDNDEISSEPDRKMRRKLQTVDKMPSEPGRKPRKRVQTADEMPSEPGRKPRKRVQTADEMPSEPDRKLRRKSKITDVSSSRRRAAARRPLRGSAAGEQTAEITNGRGHQLEPAGHADDEHRSVDECEQVAEHSTVDNSVDGSSSVDEDEHVAEHSAVNNSSDGARCADGDQVAEHSSVDNSNDGDSVRCPVCSIPFTTQDVATPDTCDHTFCAACLQEWSQNENNCPVDKNMFDFILVRHHLGGEIIMRIPVEMPNRQNERSLCCKYKLGHVLLPAFIAAYIAAFYVAGQVLMAHFSS
jgi:hypothetical protein